MTGSLRVALVDLDVAELDGFRGVLARALPESDAATRDIDVRLVVAPGPDAPLWRWAALARAARAGEVAALAGVVLDAVVVSATSARADAARRLAAALGCRVLVLAGEPAVGGKA
jgi:hypothetical protein